MSSSNLGFHGGGATGITLFQLDPGRVNNQEEQMREEEQEDEQEEERIQQEIAKNLAGAFDDMELNLEEDEEGDDGAHHDVDDGGGGSDPYATPTSRLPAHFLTSTPYQRHNGGGEPQESGDIENIENLKVLFTARGVENDRLRAEIERLAEHKEGEMRRLRHEAGFAKAENEKLSVEVEQAQQMYAALSEENQALRRDGEMLKASLDKQAKQTEDLIARAESSDNLVQSLQSQLMDLQKKDTALKVRERNDDLIRSLQERHEKETYALQDEVNRLNTKVRKSDDEVHSLRDQLAGNQRHYDSMILEKSERIDELNRKLSDSQKRLTEMIIANSGQELGNGIGDPLKEICDLKTNLAGMTQQRNEQRKHIQDLSDEIAELQNQLSSLQNKKIPNTQSSQREISELRTQIQIKDDSIHSLKAKESDLVQERVRMKSEIMTLKNLVDSAAQGEETRKLLEENSKRQIEQMRTEVREKDQKLESQEARIKELIDQWGQETEKIRANHGDDRRQLEAVQTKYTNLKKKIRSHQNHCRARDAHHQSEIERLKTSFTGVLLGYKSKMEKAMQSRELQVESELVELKKHFDGQLETIVQDVNHLQCHQEDPQARQPVRVVGLSDEENQQPPSSSSRSGSRSEQMAKIFAEATKGVKDQLKMPPALEQRQQLQQQQEQQEQQLQSRKAAPAPLASHND